ncbi:hypothetical protein D2V93_17070 [Flagellimonas taeanensis]|uniref:hypothetical protein n=1 Tax=Flavobacteriaceae TaxID=49546 RepID=UPI000E69C90B|nr:MULTISPECIES: hypothetical protein [Allomuricauda]MDC6384101.1 hypothetical protein [Muricauda sp. SK9]RIV48705.1 hypothetical protein D2V93_17070 [Allomuricauda taeanensis]
MKKIVLALMLFSFALGFSQDDEGTYSKILDKQIEALQLSGDKKDAFVEISEKYFEKIKATRESEVSRMSKFKELKAIQDSKNKEMEALLTESEFETYKELQKENREMMKDRYKQQKKS